MLNIFSFLILIFKIIGIVLLSIIGLLIAIILMILFIPVRYSFKVNKFENSESPVIVNGKLTYLLHLINIHIQYPSDELLKVRISIFKLWPREFKKKIKNKKTEMKQPISADIKDDIVAKKEDEKLDLSDINKNNNDNKEDIKENKVEDSENKDIKKKPKISLKNKIKEFCFNIKNKFITFRTSINDIDENLNYYINIIESKQFKAAFELCKDSIIKLFKGILPNKIKGNVEFGSENPELVGKVFGIYSIFYPKFRKNFKLTPYFDKDIITADVIIKGKITVIKIAVIGLKIYFNNNIKRVIKLLKKEKINGR